MKEQIKVGDTVFIEQAWEDSHGEYHDADATVLEVGKDQDVKGDGLLKLDWGRKESTSY